MKAFSWSVGLLSCMRRKSGQTWAHVGRRGQTWADLGRPGQTWAHLGTPGQTWADRVSMNRGRRLQWKFMEFKAVGTEGVKSSATMAIAPLGCQARSGLFQMVF